MKEWIVEIITPIIVGVGNWFSKWSTQKSQAKHEERMREYDLMEKALEEPETMPKRVYAKWFYEQELAKHKMKKSNKSLKEVKAVSQNYKTAFKEAQLLDIFDSLEQQHQAVEILSEPKKEVSYGSN